MRRLVAFVVKSLKQWTMSTEPAAATSQISSKQNNGLLPIPSAIPLCRFCTKLKGHEAY